MTAAEIRTDLEAAKKFRHLDRNQMKMLALRYAWNLVNGNFSPGTVAAELQSATPFKSLDARQEKMLALYLSQLWDLSFGSLTLTDGTNLTLTDGTDLRLTTA